MKSLKNKIQSIAAILVASLFLISCAPENKESKSLKELDSYVNELDTKADANWEEVEAKYEEKKAAAEKDVEQFSEKQKKQYNDVQEKFEEKRMKYAEKAEKEAEKASQQSAINKMYLTVQSPDRNLSLEAITAGNIKNAYSSFVAYIKSNQDAMSIETWKEAELIWDALNERKNVVEPKLASADNNEIAKLKVEYGVLKTKNKPGAKMEEKEATEEEREMKN